MNINRINTISATGIFRKSNKSHKNKNSHPIRNTAIIATAALSSVGLSGYTPRVDAFDNVSKAETRIPYTEILQHNSKNDKYKIDLSDLYYPSKPVSPMESEPERVLVGYTYMDEEGNIITANEKGITTKTTPEGTVFFYDPETGETVKIKEPERVLEGYTYMDEEGNIITANEKGITTKTTPEGEVIRYNP